MVFAKTNEQLSNLRDEDYLIARATKAWPEDRIEAKTWMITARMMFPKNMEIFHKSYILEKEDRNPKEAARFLQVLLKHVTSTSDPLKVKLQEEVACMVRELQNQEQEQEEQERFLVQIFKNLPVSNQERVLLNSAEEAYDALAKSKQYLLVFDLFPNLIKVHGTEFLTNVIARCKKQQEFSPSPLLTLLALKICPKLLPCPVLSLSRDVLMDLLSLCVRFCSLQISHLFSKASNLSAKTPSKISWVTIFSTLEEVGKRLGWTLTRDMTNCQDETMRRMADDIKSKMTNQMSEAGKNEMFHVALFLFLKSLSHYAEFQATNDVVLLEGFVGHTGEGSGPLKRRRTEEDVLPLVTHGKETSNGHIDAFRCAMSFWNLLQCDHLTRLLDNFQIEMGAFQWFLSDISHFKGEFRKALGILSNISIPNSSSEKCRLYLKMAAIQFCLGNLTTVAELLIRAVSHLSDVPNSDDAGIQKGSMLKQPTTKSRHVHFMPFFKQGVLSYCCRILVYLLQDTIMQSISPSADDLAFGHVIVLLQYNYSEELDLFNLILHRISMKDKFSYPYFTDYVIHIELLEEISALVNDKDCTLAWDLSPSTITSSTTSQRRMGTRGANRGEMEEVKKLLQKQVARSNENLDDIITDFLLTHRDAILSCLLRK